MMETNCKLCGSNAVFICEKSGKIVPDHSYELYHCPECDFYFIKDPILDYEKIYNLDYYRGKGADPLVDYIYENQNPNKSIRIFEYEGILDIITTKISLNNSINWLDIGCGTGGLLQYIKNNFSNVTVKGYDSGYGVVLAKENRIDVISENEMLNIQNKFDIITAIETLEHVNNPKEFMLCIEKCLKPGGLFFFTTGNSDPFHKKICDWSYFNPEIHINLFNEKSIKKLHDVVGLNYIKLSKKEKVGYSKIYKYKILKNLRIKNKNVIFEFIPWNLLFPLFDMKFKLCWGIGMKKD